MQADTSGGCFFHIIIHDVVHDVFLSIFLLESHNPLLNEIYSTVFSSQKCCLL